MAMRSSPSLRKVLTSYIFLSTYCEKQITSSSTNFLYCSEVCRRRDLSSTHSRNASISNSPSSPSFPSPLPYTRSFSTIYPTDGPDIVPRASPTTLRPRSYYNSDPYPEVTYSTTTSSQSGHKPSYSTSSSALDSLRELSAALENTRPEVKERTGSRSGSDAESELSAPPSPISRSSSGVWSYMTFASSATTGAAMKQVARPYTQPRRSYTQPSMSGSAYGADYKIGYNYSNGGNGGVSTQRYATTYTTTAQAGLTRGMTDRPLPPRSGGYGHRPKSMDLVTPYPGAI